MKISVHRMPLRSAMAMFFTPSIKIRLSRRRSFGSRKLAAKRTRGLFGLEISSLIKSISDLLQSFSLKIDSQENHHPPKHSRFRGPSVATRGVEPRRLAAQDPKSCVSANFTKRP